ncbi:hypothetical protein JTE90_028750 [Oedothorax gibbosus]|uniref:Uncharacterized protein n=1 Tax=Oedothorax gibbosus TaxID=931172 RepID=A0AAV6VWT4_9ARAC|nr:hypothetical protein JTE90_021713 [Oedothorax gibbosus]KAG8201079.1 hypothetical protein JTE90_028750 [Oedothorax gibbosus]
MTIQFLKQRFGQRPYSLFKSIGHKLARREARCERRGVSRFGDYCLLSFWSLMFNIPFAPGINYWRGWSCKTTKGVLGKRSQELFTGFERQQLGLGLIGDMLLPEIWLMTFDF